MRRTLGLLLRGWVLGLSAYLLVQTRDLTIVYAQAPIDTDCSTDLDEPDATYVLTGNVSGDCIIAADNIILDGQGLYEISGSVNSTTTTMVNFTVQNVTVDGNIYNYGYTNDAGDVTLDNVSLGGTVSLLSFHDVGDLSVLNSTVTSSVYSQSSGYAAGNVTVDHSTVGSVYLNGGTEAGEIRVTDSTVGGRVQNNGQGPDSRIIVIDSILHEDVRAASNKGDSGTTSNIVIEGTTVSGDVISMTSEGNTGTISVSQDSVIDEIQSISSDQNTGTITVTDSVAYTIHNEAYYGSGDITVTNSDITGDILNHSYGYYSNAVAGAISLNDSTVGGNIRSESVYAGYTEAITLVDSEAFGIRNTAYTFENSGAISLTRS